MFLSLDHGFNKFKLIRKPIMCVIFHNNATFGKVYDNHYLFTGDTECSHLYDQTLEFCHVGRKFLCYPFKENAIHTCRYCFILPSVSPSVSPSVHHKKT